MQYQLILAVAVLLSICLPGEAETLGTQVFLARARPEPTTMIVRALPTHFPSNISLMTRLSRTPAAQFTVLVIPTYEADRTMRQITADVFAAVDRTQAAATGERSDRALGTYRAGCAAPQSLARIDYVAHLGRPKMHNSPRYLISWVHSFARLSCANVGSPRATCIRHISVRSVVNF